VSGKSKSEFWWATVAGADCEPVEVVKKDGERLAYTCGCGDPFYLDRPDCPAVLVDEMNRPMTPKKEKNYYRRQARQAAIAVSHSWRGPR
jgi:hypothetical protein